MKIECLFGIGDVVKVEWSEYSIHKIIGVQVDEDYNISYKLGIVGTDSPVYVPQEEIEFSYKENLNND